MKCLIYSHARNHNLIAIKLEHRVDVRAGRLIELDVNETTTDSDIEDMCKKLLANTVIENFAIERSQRT